MKQTPQSSAAERATEQDGTPRRWFDKLLAPVPSTAITALIWTLLLAASLYLNIGHERAEMMLDAEAAAHTNINKDISFRKWATGHGGVYVPVTATQQSVPWLAHVPGRDVTTSDGRELTLLNPASMMRQVMDTYSQEFGVKGRITGLRQLNPANAPDAWEKEQLEAFGRGEKLEATGVSEIDGTTYLRHLRAMFMTPGCEKCHAILGYKEGDLRGAIGVNIPLAPYQARLEKSIWQLSWTHGAIWFFGLAGIGWFGQQSHRYRRERELKTYLLHQSEQHYRGIFENAADAILLISLDGHIRDANPKACRLYGYEHDEFVGMHGSEFVHPDHAWKFADALAAIQSGQNFSVESVNVRKDGSAFPIEVHISPFAHQGEEVMLCSILDITERKQAEARLLETLNLNGKIFSSSMVGIITYLVETGQCVFANEAAAKAVNATVEQLLAQNFREIESWKRSGLLAAVEETIASGTDRRVEINITSTFGRNAWLDVMLSTFSANGKTHLILMYEDITGRKAADAKIQRLTNLYIALSECNQAIVRCTCEAELFPQICRDVVLFGGMKMAWIGLLDVSSRQVKPVASYGSGLEYLEGILISADADDPHGRGPVGTAIRENHPVWNQDFLNDPLTAPWHERAAQFGWGAVAALPLHRGGEVIGAFNLYAGEVNAFDADARRLMEEMATDISYALDGFERDASLKLAAEVFEQGREGIMITDIRGSIVRVNHAFTVISGYSEAEALGQNPRMLSSGRQGKEFYRDMWLSINTFGHWQGEIWNRRKDGGIYPEWLAISRVLDAGGKTSHYVGIFNDITRHKADEERIRRLAHFDVLTGLPNRALLNDRSRHAISMAQRSRAQLAVLFVDLDHFKNINDTLGHRIGDELLVEVAKRLKSAVRDEDTVSRQGGDEFIVVLPGTDADGAAHVAEKLLESVARLFVVEQHELIITPSIGIAMYPGDGEDFDTLSKCADTAMYRAKQDGRNAFRFFTPEMQERSARNLQLENALRHALERGQLQLHYQPQVALKDGRIIGVEALLRWQHPELGAVSPAEFIPVAEDSGLILSIGEWVLRSAVRQMKAWLDSGLASMTIAVNLSAVQFRHANLPDLVTQILAEEGLQPQYLELELTEGVAMDDPLAAIAVMDDLHARGIRMSIDDFGTGYSSLSYLKRFQVYKLKIDQSFVRDITVDPEDKAIVGAIISLANSLGLQTIAEGVETESQLAFLREQGCNEVQGFYFSRAVPAEALEAFVRGRA